MLTLAAFFALRSRTLSPWAAILALSSNACPEGAADVAGAAAGAGRVMPGFQSWPVAVLNSAFKLRRLFTSASISAYWSGVKTER